MSPISGSETTAARAELILDAKAVASLPSTALRGTPGISYTTLWKDPRDGSNAGIMRLQPGAAVRPHVHGSGIHHVWISAGECVVGGRILGPGAYCQVPAGVEHGIEVAGTNGCTFFYLYQRV